MFFHVVLKKKVMKDISIYFTPIELDKTYEEQTIGSVIEIYRDASFPDLKSGGVAIIYVPEFRGVRNKPDHIDNEKFRDYFNDLCVGLDWKFPIYDLGNIIPGNEVKDTWFALGQVVAELVKKKILPVIIGGGQDLTMAV
jgi:hypothetical protein